MSKPDEYRANHRMAGISRKPNEKGPLAADGAAVARTNSKPANIACRPRPKSKRRTRSELNTPNSISVFSLKSGEPVLSRRALIDGARFKSKIASSDNGNQSRVA